MRPALSPKQRRGLFLKELSTYREFLSAAEKPRRQLVFYSAQAHYFSFYEGLLAELCERGAVIGYITSDHDDPILADHHPNIHPRYLDALFPFLLPFLDAKVVVMTMPDLNLFHVRRSTYNTNHVYLFHSLMSTHMGFRPGALDHFDTILCAGPHHKDEITRTENLYRRKPKLLLETGYYRLEKIYADHRRYLAQNPGAKERPLILIAPSGHAANITATCARELVAALLGSGCDVVYRPHPMTIYRKPEQVNVLKQVFLNHPGFRLDLEPASETSFHQADVLISDWSGAALEYAFGTERPVLFVDLPVRMQNPEYHRLDIPPAEIYLRDKIGELIRVEDIHRAGEIVRTFIERKDEYREKIVTLRENYIFHFGNSSKIGAQQILALLERPPAER